MTLHLSISYCVGAQTYPHIHVFKSSSVSLIALLGVYVHVATVQVSAVLGAGYDCFA